MIGPSAAEICMAVGKQSLEDWPHLHDHLGEWGILTQEPRPFSG